MESHNGPTPACHQRGDPVLEGSGSIGTVDSAGLNGRIKALQPFLGLGSLAC